MYIHMKARLQAHRGNTTPRQNRGRWAPRGQLTNPNAMDTSAGRTCGRIAGSEEVDPRTMRGGFIPRGRYTPWGGFTQGQKRTRDLSEVECYTCHKKGHLSRNCPQHTWNQQSQGRKVVVDDRSIIEDDQVLVAHTQTPQQQANTWLRGMASAGEEVQELVMRDLVGREGFQNA